MVTSNMLRVYEGIIVFLEKKIIVSVLDLIKCLKQIKQQLVLLTCAPNSELPSNISTMLLTLRRVSEVIFPIFQ